MIALALGLGLLIGVTLGALGGGGSILTVPVLVYLLDQSPQAATTASLVIVGVASAVAAVGHARQRVRWLAGAAFGVVGVPASLLGTRLNAAADPDVLLVSFAALMLVAATAMLAKTLGPARPEETAGDDEQVDGSTSRTAIAAKVAVAGLVVGFLTGFLGVGGGFVIVPALVLALRYDMPTAVGTSLLVISLNSAVALLARGAQGAFPWDVIVPFTLAAVAGSFGGRRVADRVSATALTRAFAALLLLVALYVLARAGLGL